MSDRTPQPLTDEQLADIQARVETSTPGPWVLYEEYGTDFYANVSGPYLRGVGTLIFGDGEDADADREFTLHAREDVPALLAEVQRLKDELAKYVGAEPTIAEELAYLNRCLNAVYDVCDDAKRQARRWEQPLPVPEWVAVVEQAADGQRPDNDLSDRRRRIYIDGKGEAWLDQSVTSDGTRWIAPLAGCMPSGTEPEGDVRDRTGSLREIGRCW